MYKYILHILFYNERKAERKKIFFYLNFNQIKIHF